MKNPFSTVRTFTHETIVELKKASWPSFAELRESTVVVLIAIAIMGVFIAVSDFSITNVVTLFTSWVR